MSQYKFPYHILRDNVVLSPVNGRLGQLLSGALEDGAATLNLGGKANTLRVKVGDIFRLISDEALLSDNAYAEPIVVNYQDRRVVTVTDQTITVDPVLVNEPNSSSMKFFEYQVLRESPYHKVTFARADQTAFVAPPAVTTPAPTTIAPTSPVPTTLAPTTPIPGPGTMRMWLNGEELAPTITNPSGEVVLVEDDFGTLTFTPLGYGRWQLHMGIVVDGTFDIVIEDGAELVEISLSNMNVFQDIPMFTLSGDGDRLGPWLISRQRIAERTMGSTYVTGNPTDVRLRRVLVEADRERIPVGTTAEFLVVLKNRDDLERINLDGCLITWEIRDSVRRKLVATGIADIVSAGLVRVQVDANVVPEGVFTLETEINFGGNPEFILRTNPVIFYVGG